MKRSLICLFLLISFLSYSQTVVRLKNGSVYLEKDYSAYWVSSSSNLILQNGVLKAIKWAGINEEYMDDFEKEIVRFRVMNKDTYQFHGYVSKFTEEAKLIFHGFSNGNFMVSFFVDHSKAFEITDKVVLQNLLKLLQGKKIHNEINDRYN